MTKLGCKILLIIILGFFLGSCAPEVRYRIQVTGYSQPSAAPLPPPPAAFYVIDNWQAQDPPLSREVKGKIEKLLGIKGYIITSFEQADYYLVYSFGQGPGPPVTVPMPVYRPRRYPYYGGPWQPYRMAPVPGYDYGSAPSPLYDRWLIVNVMEGPRYRDKKEFQRLWQGEARSTGYSPNMAATVNYLLMALFEVFGKNTGRGQVVEVNENDFRAEELFSK